MSWNWRACAWLSASLTGAHREITMANSKWLYAGPLKALMQWNTSEITNGIQWESALLVYFRHLEAASHWPPNGSLGVVGDGSIIPLL